MLANSLLGGRVGCRQARMTSHEVVQGQHHAERLCQGCNGVPGMLTCSTGASQHSTSQRPLQGTAAPIGLIWRGFSEGEPYRTAPRSLCDIGRLVVDFLSAVRVPDELFLLDQPGAEINVSMPAGSSRCLGSHAGHMMPTPRQDEQEHRRERADTDTRRHRLSGTWRLASTTDAVH